MAMKKYNSILTSEIWYTKDPKDAQILTLVGVSHNLVDKSKK